MNQISKRYILFVIIIIIIMHLYLTFYNMNAGALLEYCEYPILKITPVIFLLLE